MGGEGAGKYPMEFTSSKCSAYEQVQVRRAFVGR